MSLSPKHLTAVAIATLALPLAACGDDDSASGDAAAADAPVAIASADGTDVLADADGRTLYTADVEANGEIACTGECTTIWEPALGSAADAQAAAGATGADISVVERPDGERQLALADAPLYTFTEESPGELSGDGLSDEFAGTAFVWSAATAPGEPEPDATAPADDAVGGY